MKLFLKIVAVAMILSLLSTSILQTTASAATSGDSANGGDELVEFENVDSNDKEISRASGEKVTAWMSGIIIGFVGYQMGQVVITNIINNGIKATCKKYDDNWGMRQACKLIHP